MSQEITLIPIDEVKIQKFNVRKKDIQTGIEDLAASIKAVGLLQPITVFLDSENNRYVILAGQRRFNAYTYLNEEFPGDGFDKIRAIVIPEPKSDQEKMALSLAENVTQLPMQNLEIVKAVTELYNTYHDYAIVKEKFGLTEYMINKYVRLARLPQAVVDAINDGQIHSNPKTAENAALRAVDALNYTKGGEVDEAFVVEMAKEYAKGEIEEELLTAEAKKGGDISEIKSRASKKTTKKIEVNLSTDVHTKLSKVADNSGTNASAKATSYVLEGVNKDYNELEE
jgi:ParB family transcriptional regulator, chromosome partitioning protein